MLDFIEGLFEESPRPGVERVATMPSFEVVATPSSNEAGVPSSTSSPESKERV